MSPAASLGACLAVAWLAGPAAAADGGFRCAGVSPELGSPVRGGPVRVAGKAAGRPVGGTRNAVVIFARFLDEGGPEAGAGPPAWASGLLDLDLPGSVSHFYATMSSGALRIAGAVAPRWYESEQTAAAQGDYGTFALQILRQADRDVDFARFDNDGPDGVPNSGDDDGAVDAVFLATASAPRGFLRGGATGIAGLGFKGDYLTGDAAVTGDPIRIVPRQGTVQRGATFAEAAGAMSHEYGHLLGLPDLYDTDFLLRDGAPPEDDSAGIGAWGLMGWGAAGWGGGDGPNSLSAWSRVQLGWSEVVEVTGESQEVRLDPVAAGGRVIKVPLTGVEYFLLEDRRRAGSFYDRHIPGEGLLIWHVSLQAGRPVSEVVDLECADGRWLDAGYPLGRQADPERGGDNLDFWAHDAGYAQAHGGNLGDGTDPFDGESFDAFTPDTNPAALSQDGAVSVRIEGIRRQGEAMRAEVHTRPLLVRVRDVALVDADGDGIAAAGEEVRVTYRLVNEGGVPARDLQVELATADSLVEVANAGGAVGDLAVGAVSAPLKLDRYPVLRVAQGFAGTHAASAWLEVRAQGALVAQEPVVVQAVSARQEVRGLAVVDSAGNGDGAAQVGEFIRLRFELVAGRPELLRRSGVSLRALDGAVVPTSGAQVVLDLEGDQASTRQSPEFLVGAAAAGLADLRFELRVRGPYEQWLDSLAVPLAPGPDGTPPRVSGLQVRYEAGRVHLYLPASGVREGGSVREARARVDAAPTAESPVTEVPLAWQQGSYEGSWQAPGPGVFRVQAVVEDGAGNVGYSQWQEIAVPPPFPAGGQPAAAAVEVELMAQGQRPWVDRVAYGTGTPSPVWAVTQHALWRGDEAGGPWARTGLMIGTAVVEVAADAADPGVVYVLLSDGGRPARGAIVRSLDAGAHWAAVEVPGDTVAALAADPLRTGRLYAAAPGEILVSEDGGATWRGGGPADCRRLWVHPTAPDRVYAGVLEAERVVRLWRSADGGRTWTSTVPQRPLGDVAPDPYAEEGLYATSADSILHSGDGGSSFSPRSRVPRLSGMSRWLLRAHPERAGLVFAWRDQGLDGGGIWRTEDGGRSWDQILEVVRGESSTRPYVHPRDARQIQVVTNGFPRPGLRRTADGGRTWEPVELPPVGPAVGAIAFDPQHGLWAGSVGTTSDPMAVPGLYRSGDGGQTWAWRAETVLWPPGGDRGEPAAIDGVSFDPFDPMLLIADWGAVEMWWSSSFVTYAGDFLRSTDGGRTWTVIEGMYSGGRPALLADPLRSGRRYITAGARSGEGVWLSEDGGATWEARNAGLPTYYGTTYVAVTAMVLDPDLPGRLCAAVGDGVWLSDDAGGRWQRAGTVAPGERVWQLSYHPAESGQLYAVASRGVHLSRDGGATWSRLAAVGPLLARARLRFDPHDAGHLYLANGRDLLESRDAGRTWASIAAQLPGYPWFEDVGVDPLDPRWSYVATPFGLYRLGRASRVTAVDEAPPLPARAFLAPSYPNPFNGSAAIGFAVSRPGPVELGIYNALGQRVAVLADGWLGAGVHSVRWDGRDESGTPVASGVYVCRLRAGAWTESRKLLLLQ